MFSNQKTIIPKKILFLTAALLTIFVIQVCSISYVKTLAVFADTNSYIDNNNNNDGNSGHIANNLQGSTENDNNIMNKKNIIGNNNDFSNNNIINSGIAVGSYPVGIAVNPTINKIYVANEFSNTVSVIDGISEKIEATLKVGNFPYGIDVNPLNNRVYVANRGSNSISVIDGSTNLGIAEVYVGKGPIGVAVNPSSGLIYVTNIESGTVSVIDGITNTVYSTIKVGNIPYGVAVNPVTNMTYITNIGDSTISIIDNSTNSSSSSDYNNNNNIMARSLEKVGGIIAPAGIAINIFTNRAYVADYDSNAVYAIDLKTNNVIDRIKVGDKPVGISVNPISNRIYVTNIGDNTVSVIDGSKDQILNKVTVNPFLKTHFINKNDPLAKIPVGIKFPLVASLAAVNSVANTVYVTNTASNTISVIDGNKDSVLVKLNFNTNPPNAGEIMCNGVRNLGANSILYTKGELLQCIANSHHGFNFDSWSGMIDSLSNPLTVHILQFGPTLTANFDPAFPPETYLLIGLGSMGSIPVFLGWYSKGRQKHYLNVYLTRIESVYDRFFQVMNYSKEEYIAQLEQMRREILDLFKRGKISDTYYNILDKKTTDYISLGLDTDKKDRNA